MAYCTAIYIYISLADYTPWALIYSRLFSGGTLLEPILISVAKLCWNLYSYHALGMTFVSYAIVAMIGLTMRGVRIDFNAKMNVTLEKTDIKSVITAFLWCFLK